VGGRVVVVWVVFVVGGAGVVWVVLVAGVLVVCAGVCSALLVAGALAVGAGWLAGDVGEAAALRLWTGALCFAGACLAGTGCVAGASLA
jgi:hypothetical protein